MNSATSGVTPPFGRPNKAIEQLRRSENSSALLKIDRSRQFTDDDNGDASRRAEFTLSRMPFGVWRDVYK